jgi:hypothetical protein
VTGLGEGSGQSGKGVHPFRSNAPVSKQSTPSLQGSVLGSHPQIGIKHPPVHRSDSRISTGLVGLNWDQIWSSTMVCLILTRSLPWPGIGPIQQRSPSISNFKAVHRFSWTPLLLCKVQYWAHGLQFRSNMLWYTALTYFDT